MISRIWHGYTSRGNADAYEALLKSEIFTGIASRGIAGYKGIQLFRRNLGEEVASRNPVLLNGTKHDEHGHFNAGSPPVATALSP